jgi:hypothetical protein
MHACLTNASVFVKILLTSKWTGVNTSVFVKILLTSKWTGVPLKGYRQNEHETGPGEEKVNQLLNNSCNKWHFNRFLKHVQQSIIQLYLKKVPDDATLSEGEEDDMFTEANKSLTFSWFSSPYTSSSASSEEKYAPRRRRFPLSESPLTFSKFYVWGGFTTFKTFHPTMSGEYWVVSKWWRGTKYWAVAANKRREKVQGWSDGSSCCENFITDTLHSLHN